MRVGHVGGQRLALPLAFDLGARRRPLPSSVHARPVLKAARQFVSAPETCQRRPARALPAGALLSYGAATAPAIRPGF
jgi:hypothetical protein